MSFEEKMREQFTIYTPHAYQPITEGFILEYEECEVCNGSADEWAHTVYPSVVQNNWLLPLVGESWDVHPVNAARLQWWIKHEATPVFDRLNSDEFWKVWFTSMTCKQLIAHHKALGVKIQSDKLKILLVATLVAHWTVRIDEISREK